MLDSFPMGEAQRMLARAGGPEGNNNMKKQASKTETARVTMNDRTLDSFSVNFTVETREHTYRIAASWSTWDGWDIDVTDETGAEHDAETLADDLGYGCASDLLATLSEGIYLTGDRQFSLTFPAGA